MTLVIRNVGITVCWTSRGQRLELALRIARLRIRRLALLAETRFENTVPARRGLDDELAVCVASRRVGRLALFSFTRFEQAIAAVRDLPRYFAFFGAAVTGRVVAIVALLAVGEAEDAVAADAATNADVDVTHAVGIRDSGVQSVVVEDLWGDGLQGRIRGVLREVGWGCLGGWWRRETM